MTDILTSPPKPNPQASRVNISCGDCVFFENVKLANASSTCSGMGCPRNRAPCLKFSANVFSGEIADAMEDKELRRALNSVSDAAAAALAMTISDIPRLRAAGFSLGQLVYFNAVGNSASRDYVANYYSGRVMKVDTQGNLLIRGRKVSATIVIDSVLTLKVWERKHQALVASKAIFDPKSPYTWERRDRAIFIKDKYRPPWLDASIKKYREDYREAKSTRQTHDYDSTPVKRGRGRPRKDGSTSKPRVKTADVSATG